MKTKTLKHAITSAAFIALMSAALPAEAARITSTSDYVRLRAGPDRQYPAVATIPAGAKVDIKGCIRQWDWCDVKYKRARGWISSKYLVTSNNRGRAVYVDRLGPVKDIPILSFIFGDYWDTNYRSEYFYRDRDRYYEIYDPNWRRNRDRDRNRGRDWDNDHDRGDDWNRNRGGGNGHGDRWND